MLRLLAVLALAVAGLSACVVVPVPVRRPHVVGPPAVIVTPPYHWPYDHYPRHRDRRRW
jgi:hypothetical protein